MKEFSIRRYRAEDFRLWNEFIRNSRNGNFLFDRNYMDYHADRFPDSSFLFFADEKLCAVIPGTLDSEGTFGSHSGLTFGGFVLDDSVGVSAVGTLFELLDAELKSLGAKRVVYKPLPWIYAERPSQEDLYWLFRKNAKLSARLISCTLEPGTTQPSSKKKYYLHKGIREGLVFSESVDYEKFWDLLDDCLVEGHGAHPVHSKAELNLLAGRFPQNIKLFTVTRDGELLSGSVVYVSSRVAHSQYLASSAKGRALHAMDFLMLNEINRFPEQRFFDWGTSCEERGRVLNEGLAHQKETYAGRGVAYDIYEYAL